jgi:hypothetical protein
MKAPMEKLDSEYIKMMMKDVKKYPDVIEMYSKFYRGISRGDFELVLTKIIRLVIKQTTLL